MSEPIRLSDEEITEWLSHPTTKVQLDRLRLLIDRALKGVVGAAATSSDPAVRGAVSKYRTYKMMLQIFQEKHGSDQDTESREE